MIKIIVAAFVTSGICFLISSCNHQLENTRKNDIYYNSAQVVGVGQCRDSKCAFSYKTSTGSVEYGMSDTPLTTGQLVYQQCWTEKVKGPQCYTEYKPSDNSK
jgi:hypothetical protein